MGVRKIFLGLFLNITNSGRFAANVSTEIIDRYIAATKAALRYAANCGTVGHDRFEWMELLKLLESIELKPTAKHVLFMENKKKIT